ncbi:MAG: glycosyltransferase [Bacteroidia bacterium]|nr:glycosyltransferase [Bacteroidia bacterium]
MKIILLGTAYPYRGGLAAYNERLAGQFAIEGHEVRIFTFSLQYPGFLFPGKSQYIDGSSPEGINIERRINSINPFNWISVGYKIRKEKPDILIIKYWLPFMSPCFGTIARIARSDNHTKVICIFDNVIPHEKKPGDRLLTKYFVNCIHGAVAMSQSVMNDLRLFRKYIPAKLNPHPLFDNFGVPVNKEDALTKLGLDPDSKYLLFFGFIRAYKGLDLLIKAFADNRLRNKHLKLIIAGEFYENSKPYLDLVKKHNLENDIIFYGRFINDNEVKIFFSVADLVVQPYKTATQSGVTQIAFHFEKPMLVTDVGGLREIVPDGICGYVVKPEPNEITESILDYFDNNREAHFTEGVKKEKDKFTWNKMTASIIEVYNKCLTTQT